MILNIFWLDKKTCKIPVYLRQHKNAEVILQLLLRRPLGIIFVEINKILYFVAYRIFSNKRPLSFKRPSPINAQHNPKNIL